MNDMLTDAEIKSFARLKTLSSAAVTPADRSALKQEVVEWVRAGKSPVTRQRRREWSRGIPGAYSPVDGGPPRVVWSYLEPGEPLPGGPDSEYVKD